MPRLSPPGDGSASAAPARRVAARPWAKAAPAAVRSARPAAAASVGIFVGTTAVTPITQLLQMLSPPRWAPSGRAAGSHATFTSPPSSGRQSGQRGRAADGVRLAWPPQHHSTTPLAWVET